MSTKPVAFFYETNRNNFNNTCMPLQPLLPAAIFDNTV